MVFIRDLYGEREYEKVSSSMIGFAESDLWFTRTHPIHQGAHVAPAQLCADYKASTGRGRKVVKS